MSIDLPIKELELLKSAIYDPRFKDSYDLIRNINQGLLNGQISHDEATAHVAKIDEGIGLDFGTPMVVTGIARRYNDSEIVLQGGTPNVIDTSNTYGYADLPCNDEILGYYGSILEVTDGSSQVKILAAKRTDAQGEEGEIELYSVDVDRAMIDFPTFTSYDRAVAWLRSYAPSIMEKIDSILAKGERDGASIILDLKGIDLSEAVSAGDLNRARLSIDTVVSELAKPDDVLPYEITFDGTGFVQREDNGEFKQGIIRLSAYIRFDGLACIIAPPDDSGSANERLEIVILARVVQGPNVEDDVSAMLNVDGVQSIESTRYTAFNL